MKGKPQAKNLTFLAPRRVTVRPGRLPSLGAGQVLVETRLSAISAGTEMLIYRGLAPREMQADEIHPGLDGRLVFPIRYGYACVGQVTDLGDQVEDAWLGRRVFGFVPHADRFVASIDQLLSIPPSMPDERAVFLPQAETAVGLVHDGAPLLGERICVFGQGVVGLLVTALLARLPQVQVLAFDRYARRREISLSLGASACLDSSEIEAARRRIGGRGADLTFELSGDPRALDTALSLTGYGGRVIVGSWYGRRPSQLDLGGAFHRSHIRILSSQVSRIDPVLSGRWDKSRRWETAWRVLDEVQPEAWITHRLPFAQAAQAYQILDRRPQDALQIVFTFS